MANEVSQNKLGIVFKISERCNLKCSYCYYFFSGDETWKDRAPIVSDSVIGALGMFSRSAAEKYGISKIPISFHGGEPLLMKKSKFDQMCTTLREHESNFQFEFAVQTNGALIDEEWIEILQRHDVGVGVSLDGPKQINDLHRLDKRGRSSYEKTVRGLRLLQKSAKAHGGRIPGALCVINPEADGAATLRHFVEDLEVTHLNFLLPDASHENPLSMVDRGRITDFLRAVIREWARLRRKDVSIRFLSELITLFAGDEQLNTSYNTSDYRHLIVVSSDGKIGPEDTLHGLAERFRETPYSVFTTAPEELFSSPVWDELGDAARGPDACQSCEWFRVCRGGRLANRFSESGSFNNPSIYCDGLKQVYADVMRLLVANHVDERRISANLRVAL